MLGMLGIIVKNSQIQNTTQIIQEIKLGEKYLVRFLNPPAFNRVCNTEEIQQWLLFQDQAEANAWVETSQQPPPEATAPEAAPPTAPPAPTGKNGAGEPTPESDIEGGDESPETPVVIPAKPVALPAHLKEQIDKELQPDIDGGKDPDDSHGKKS